MSHIHNTDHLLFERFQERQHEIEQQRQLAHSRQPGPSRLQYLIGSLGTFFVTLGTKLQQFKQRHEQVV